MATYSMNTENLERSDLQVGDQLVVMKPIKIRCTHPGCDGNLGERGHVHTWIITEKQ
jgi:hypothetical protein